jgi:hypothetical protein
VLHALLQVPEDVAPRPRGQVRGRAGGVEGAIEFLRSRVDSTGALGRDGPVLDYPNYATAYALRVFAEHGAPADTGLVRRMAVYLAGQQLTEARGFAPDHPAYGAWGFGEAGLTPQRPGHVDLSHTRRVLAALRAAGALAPEAATAATTFLRMLQKHPTENRPQPPAPGSSPGQASRRGAYGGGFYASSVTLGVNKAGLDQDGRFRPYATATADGLIALIEAGHAVDSEPVQAALRWLREHPGWDAPAGIPTDNPARWDRVMRLYHIAARAEAYGVAGAAGWEDEALAALAGFRREDGSFSNTEGAANKEDDPLLATAFAVEALTRMDSP